MVRILIVVLLLVSGCGDTGTPPVNPDVIEACRSTCFAWAAWAIDCGDPLACGLDRCIDWLIDSGCHLEPFPAELPCWAADQNPCWPVNCGG